MSNQQPFSPPSNVGEVDHVHLLSEQLDKLYLNEEYSDITLIIDKTRFTAHKVILAARSQYFRALLFGGMREANQEEIELQNTPIPAFKHLLKYIYTGHISLASLKEELIIEILSLADQYGFVDLETAISEYLKATLNVKTVCLIYDTSSLFKLDTLTKSALLFIDTNVIEVLNDDSFLTLSELSVQELITRDSFWAEEIVIFKALARWAKANPDIDMTSVIKGVRLSLINVQDLLKVVRPTDLIPADVLLDAIQSRTETKDSDLKYRGYKMVDENVALPRHGASVIVGEGKTALLNGDSKNFDMEKGFSRHSIDQTGDVKGIVVQLGMPCIINRINMLLWDQDQRAYSYYIDVSMDQVDWSRVVYHTRFHCRSWQYLYFPQRVVNFIRIVGTHNTVNKVFHVVALEAMYTEQIENLDLGVIVPKTNVATLDSSALVIEGVCRSRNALLNGDTSNYDWDTGYTCHQLGSGAIVVQLGQPYALDSMRLLLWDCDDRSYSYYIEVSNDLVDWEIVCDRTRERCKSWQIVRFNRRPVVFIRIVGTHNTENEVFHCVHFEAPAMGDVQDQLSSSEPVTSHHSNITDDTGEDEIELARAISTDSDDLSEGNLQGDGAVAGSHRDPLQGLSVPLSGSQARFNFPALSVPLTGRGLNPPFINLGPGHVMERNQLQQGGAAIASGILNGAFGDIVDGLQAVALPQGLQHRQLQQIPQLEGGGASAGGRGVGGASAGRSGEGGASANGRGEGEASAGGRGEGRASASGRGEGGESAGGRGEGGAGAIVGRGNNNENHQLQGLHGAVPRTSSRIRPNLRGSSLPDL